MNSFKNPLVPIITNPVNIDRPIQALQQSLATLPWLAKSFGRSFESFRKDSANKVWTYPEVWQGAGIDLLNAMPNDNLNSQSFFKVEDPIEVIDYEPNRYSKMKARVSIIFWFNLKLIDPDLDYRYVELLKGQAQRVITESAQTHDSSFAITRIWETAVEVFRGYTMDLFTDQALVHPFGGFRFETALTFNEDCPNVALTPET